MGSEEWLTQEKKHSTNIQHKAWKGGGGRGGGITLRGRDHITLVTTIIVHFKGFCHLTCQGV